MIKIVYLVEKWGEPWNEGYKNLAKYTYQLLKNIPEININVLTKESGKLNELRDCDFIWIFNYPETPAFIFHIMKTKLGMMKTVVKFLAKKELDINFKEKVKTMLYRDYMWNAVVTTTELLKLEMSRYLRSTKMFVLPPPIPTDYFHPIKKDLARKVLGLEENLIYIGYCGKINKSVKLNVITEAFKDKTLFKNAALLFAISYIRTKNDFYNFYNSLANLRKAAIPVKFVRVNDIRLFYSAIDLLLYPVEREGSIEPPLTLMEAMSCGTPVATFENPIIRDIIKNGYTGFTFKQPSELRTIIEELLEGSRIFHIISKQARRVISEAFSYSKLFKTYLNFINLITDYRIN